MNDYWDRKPDLTRLPPTLKDSLNKPIPFRPHEVRARVLISPTVGQNHPNGRFLIAPHRPNSDSSVIEGLRVEALDYAGKLPLATIILKNEDFFQALQGALLAYKKAGGSLAQLVNLVEEIDNDGRHSRDESEV